MKETLWQCSGGNALLVQWFIMIGAVNDNELFLSKINLERISNSTRVLLKGEVQTWVEPVSWFSIKVTARDGHHPRTPGGFPFWSDKRQYSHLSKAYMENLNNIC